jgi:hypothetical protein
VYIALPPELLDDHLGASGGMSCEVAE